MGAMQGRAHSRVERAQILDHREPTKRLSRLQRAILCCLEGCREPIRISELRRRLGLLGFKPSPSSLSRSLKRLRERGLIKALRPLQSSRGRILWVEEWSKTQYITPTQEGFKAIEGAEVSQDTFTPQPKTVDMTRVKLTDSGVGVKVSRETLTGLGESSPLVLVRYRDHLLFRDLNARDVEPVVRETVGWLIGETPEALFILWDRSVEPLPRGRMEPKASGLVLLRGDVISIRRLEA